MAAELVRDDPAWWYQGFGWTTATRRLRLYRVAPRRLVAVVTERGPGTSITNAAETVAAQLAVEYPDDVVELIEHYPADVGAEPLQHFDAVTIHPTGEPSWRRIPADELVARLGPGVLSE